MEAQDPLSDLADIHLPALVPWWPPAPGWWVLAALALAALAALGLQWYRRWQQQQRLLRCLAELRAAASAWQQREDGDAMALFGTCNAVLKRVALVHYPAAEVAALSGRAWLQFLDATGGSTPAFGSGPAQLLGDAGYRPRVAADAATVQAVLSAAEQWIRIQYRGRHGSAPAREAA